MFDIEDKIKKCNSCSKILSKKYNGKSQNALVTEVLLDTNVVEFYNEIESSLGQKYIVLAKKGDPTIAYVVNGVKDLFFFMEKNNAFDSDTLVKDCESYIVEVIAHLKAILNIIDYDWYMALTVGDIYDIHSDAEERLNSQEPIDLSDIEGIE